MIDEFYRTRKSVDEILSGPVALLWDVGAIYERNMLFQGENLDVMRALLQSKNGRGSVKLVYIDPPFATNTLFRIGIDRVSTISAKKDDNVAYSDTLVGVDFLHFIYERLVVLRELMADDGSIYLHIDTKIGHYVKIIMDEVFGIENFRNDITRIKCNPKNFDRRAFGNIKDVIYFYTKSNKSVWNDPRTALGENDIDRRFNKVDRDGRRYTTVPLHAPGETNNGKTGNPWRGVLPPPGRHWRSAPEVLEQLDKEGLVEWSKNGVPRKRIYADCSPGMKIQDIWEFKDPQYPQYPTEKNVDLLKQIIHSSSNEGDIVLDCFAGSGTTLSAAESLKRTWIGIERSPRALEVIRERLGLEEKLERTRALAHNRAIKSNKVIKDGNINYNWALRDAA